MVDTVSVTLMPDASLNEPGKIGDPRAIKMTVINNTIRPALVPNNTRYTLAELFGCDSFGMVTEHFQRTYVQLDSFDISQDGTEKEIQVTIRCLRPSLEAAPSQLRVRFVVHDETRQPVTGIPVFETFCPLSFRMFTAELQRFMFPTFVVDHARTIKLATCGLYGAGKSSWLMTLMTALSDAPEVQMFALAQLANGRSSQGATHSTTRFKILQGFFDRAKMNFSAFDMWGLSPENMRHPSCHTWLTYLLDGRIPDGYVFEQQRFQQDIGHNPQAFLADPERVPHVVLFFVPAVCSPSDMQSLAHAFAVFGQHEPSFTPIVMLSRVDEALMTAIQAIPPRAEPPSFLQQLLAILFGAGQGQHEQQPRQQFTLEDVQDFVNHPHRPTESIRIAIDHLREDVARNLGVLTSRVIYTVNYTHQTERVFDIDRWAVMVLQRALQAALQPFQMT